MIVAALAALALQTTDPAAPVAAGPAPAASLAIATPNGAPADDYGFVAWCRGALTGHMDLFKTVKPELARVEAERATRENAKLTATP